MNIRCFNSIVEFKSTVLRLFRDQFSKMKTHDFDQLRNSFRQHSKNGYILTLNDLINSIANVKHLNMDKIYLNKYFNDCNINTEKDFINCCNCNDLGIIYYPDLLNALINGFVIHVQEELWHGFTELSNDGETINSGQLIQTLERYDKLTDYDEKLTVLTNDHIYYRQYFNKSYFNDFYESEKNKWQIERLVWIGYQKNIDNNKCLFAKLPKVLVNKCLSFLSSRLSLHTFVVANATQMF